MTIDPAIATARYIDGLGPDALAKAAAYTVGGHWLLLWGLVISGAVTWLVVRSGLLDRIAERLAQRGRALRTFAVCAAFMTVSAIITLPWSVYEQWWRERSYGRTSQPLGDYLAQDALGTALTIVLLPLFFLGIYALINRAGRRWWLWSGGLAAFAVVSALLVAPIAIEPLFNDYRPVPPGPVRDAVIVMADQAGIAHDRIFLFDGSRQSNNFTANVSGIGGSARIAISDVAMNQASIDEVRAVTGHEIGHYVLHHSLRMAVAFAFLAIILFFLADRVFPFFARLFGSGATIGDPTGFPVLLFIVGLFGTLAQPLINGVIRTGESEADAYSLRTVNLPAALASALVKTAEYRDPRPAPLQELLFYTHPSVERRVRVAMDWKAAHPPTRTIPALARPPRSEPAP